MPYGLPNDLDSKPEYVSWMENCVKRVQGSGKIKDKGVAVAICKTNLKKMNYKLDKASIQVDILMDLWKRLQ